LKNVLKIGQQLPKLWAIKYQVVFLMKHGLHKILNCVVICATLPQDVPSREDQRAGSYHRELVTTTQCMFIVNTHRLTSQSRQFVCIFLQF